jgi:universal stress protein E
MTAATPPQTFRRIVVGVALAWDDGLGAGTRRALLRARQVAKETGAHLSLVYSTRADERWDSEQGNFVHVANRVADEARERLAGTLSDLADSGIEAELVLSSDPAELAIIRRVLGEGADLAIVGKRAEARHDARRLGSVSMKLLHQCPCPVWVEKAGEAGPLDTIVAATDLTAVGLRVVHLAGALAVQFDSALHVVHAFQMPLDVQIGGEVAEAEFIARMRSETTERVAAQLEGVLPPEKADIHVGLTSPTRAVLEAVERLDPDLVVLGSVSRGGIAGLLIGNTAERLLGRLDCSILTVKPDDFVCPVASD